MSLRGRLTAYLVGLHLALFGFTLVLYRDDWQLFLGLEVLLLASLAGGLHLIERALEPLGYTRRFHELLQDQNYASRLEPSDSAELTGLIAEFNSMLGALGRERLALGEQRGFLERLLEATPGAVLVFDFDGRISLVNASAQALLALAAPLGKPLSHWLEADGRLQDGANETARARGLSLLAQLDQLPLGETRLLTDPEGRRYRGQRGQFFDRGFARHFLLVEELTAELESWERAAFEKLIRVLAHEVNNTVAATGSVLDSLLYYNAQLAEADRADFSTAIVAVKRRNVSLAEFIERFTRVVSMPAPEPRPVSLAAMMDDILWLSREQCKSRGVAIDWGERASVPALALDSQLMEQALLNIVKNAMEAAHASMQENGRPGYVRLALASEGGEVRLSVIDSGDRLGAVPAQRLFTPFFSTKKGGQGIGLIFVREVLTRHGLRYRLAADGHGQTRFDIWFPA